MRRRGSNVALIPTSTNINFGMHAIDVCVCRACRYAACGCRFTRRVPPLAPVAHPTGTACRTACPEMSCRVSGSVNVTGKGENEGSETDFGRGSKQGGAAAGAGKRKAARKIGNGHHTYSATTEQQAQGAPVYQVSQEIGRAAVATAALAVTSRHSWKSLKSQVSKIPSLKKPTAQMPPAKVAAT